METANYVRDEKTVQLNEKVIKAKSRNWSASARTGQDRSTLSLIIAFARFIMDKANNCTRRWKHEKAHTKQMAFVAVLLATLTLIGGCGNQEPSDTATESAPDTEVTTTGAASAAETPVVLTETQKIEKILTDRITEQYTMTQIDRITINDDLGTEADDDYIALVYLTWDQKNTGKTSKKMLEMYSSDLVATLGEQNSSVNEIAIFWTVPYLNDTAKCSYQRNGDGFVEMDMAWGKAFQ